MIPVLNLLSESITEIQYPNRTYKIVFDIENKVYNRSMLSMTAFSESDSVDRINGYTDNLDALMQSIYLILSTERYQHIIYSWDYGVELIDLIGKPMPYVMAEIPRRIKEALIQDNRIEDVVDFEFEKRGKRLHTTFTVISNIGTISVEMGVEV